jgi:hypothetical protein
LVGFTGGAFFFGFCSGLTRLVEGTALGFFFESGFAFDFARGAALATDLRFFVIQTNLLDTWTFLEPVAARFVSFTGDIDSFRFRLIDEFNEADRFATAAGFRSCEPNFLFVSFFLDCLFA